MKIAIISGSSMGDAILSIPLFRNIRKNYPDAEITVLTGEATTGLPILNSCPYIKNIIQIERNSFLKSIKSLVKIRKLKKKFNLVIIGAPITENKEKFAKMLKPEKIISTEYDRKQPIVETNLNALKKAGLKVDNGYLELFYELEKGEKSKIIAVYPGRDSDKYRKIPPHKWKQILDIIPKKYEIVFIGGNDCKETINNIKQTIGKEAQDLSGTMDIEKTAHFLNNIQLLLSINGGPMHLASAIGTPVIAINTSSRPMWRAWNPKNNNITTVWGIQCTTPCEHDNCNKDRPGCIDSVSIKKIIEAINDLL